MLIEENSDIIKNWRADTLYNGEYIELCTFKDGKVLVISSNTLSLLKNENFLNDELGNGLIAQASIPEAMALGSTPWVNKIKAGFIGFNDEKAILIMPNSITLFTNSLDALHNKNVLCQLSFES